jgi:hypothetical protein
MTAARYSAATRWGVSNCGIELVAEREPATTDFDVLFAALDADTFGELDGVRDAPNMALRQEPERVREDLRRLVALESHDA